MDTSRKHRLLAVVALGAIALAAYSNSFDAAFTLDNKSVFLQDVRIREATPENIKLIVERHYWWPNSQSGLYRPFTLLTYLFEYAVLGCGVNPVGYHWTNFFLHFANVLLVYALARRLLGERRPAWFVAALWSVHPVLTESVTNLVGRADLLSGIAIVGGLLLYLKSAEAERGRRWWWLAALTLTATVGVFSKENAAVLLGVIVLYEIAWWRGRARAKALLLGSAAVAVSLAALWYARDLVFRNLPPPDFPIYHNPLVGADFWTAKLTAVKVLGSYLGLLVWPARLSCDYSYAQIPLAAGSAADWVAWLAVAAATVAALLMYRFQRAVFFVSGLAFLTILPSSNLLFPLGTVMAERFLYLPSMALALALVVALHAAGRRFGKTRLAPVILCVLVAGCALRTWARNRDWHDDLSIAKAVVSTSPRSFSAHDLLAETLFDSDPNHLNLPQVLAEAERSISILATLPENCRSVGVYQRAGTYYLVQGDRGGSREPAYRRALELLRQGRATAKIYDDQFAAEERAHGRPGPGPYNLRMAEFERGISAASLRLADVPAALAAARRAHRLAPLAPQMHLQLALSFEAANQPDEAAVVLMEGVLLTNDAALRQELLYLYRNLDQDTCAIRGEAVNVSCPMVREHFCLGAAEAIRVNREIGRPDLADEVKATATGQFGCPK